MNKLYIVLYLLLLLSACGNPGSNKHSNHTAKVSIIPIDFPFEEGKLYGEPYLLTTENGRVFMSWRQTYQGSHQLMYAELKENVWSDPLSIATGENWFVNWADYPQILRLEGGEMLSFYLEKSGPSTFSYDIKLISSEDNWAQAITLHDDGKKVEHGFVSMIPYQGNALIAWLDGRNTSDKHQRSHSHGHGGDGPMTLRGAIVNPQGIKIKEWELDGSVCDCCQTATAMTDNGPVVIYRDRSLTEVRNINIVRLVDNKWTAPVPIYDDNWKIKGCPVNGPQADSQGNHLGIAWFSEVHGQAEVKVIFSEDGGATFGMPIRVNEGHTIGRVDLVMLNKDTAMVIWMEGSFIHARRVHKDQTLGPVITIAESSDNRSSGFPQMTMANGQLIFAWTDTNGMYPIIKSAKVEEY